MPRLHFTAGPPGSHTIVPDYSQGEFRFVAQNRKILNQARRPKKYKIAPTTEEFDLFVRRISKLVHERTHFDPVEILHEDPIFDIVWSYILENPWMVAWYRWYTGWNQQAPEWKKVNYENI